MGGIPKKTPERRTGSSPEYTKLRAPGLESFEILTIIEAGKVELEHALGKSIGMNLNLDEENVKLLLYQRTLYLKHCLCT